MLPKALESCPKSNKSPNLVILHTNPLTNIVLIGQVVFSLHSVEIFPVEHLNSGEREREREREREKNETTKPLFIYLTF